MSQTGSHRARQTSSDSAPTASATVSMKLGRCATALLSAAVKAAAPPLARDSRRQARHASNVSPVTTTSEAAATAWSATRSWRAHEGVTIAYRIDRSVSAISGATSRAGQERIASTPRRQVDDGIDRQPAEDDKVPVDRVLADV